MCGLAVLYAPELDVVVRQTAIKNMLASMSHRGPDDSRVWESADGIAFGHVRLAIQDPEHGRQPAVAPDGSCLVFNGEAYNFPELRDDLTHGHGAKFHEHGDTEVVREALRLRGRSAIDDLNGDYAFVWSPSDTPELLLVRDRFGVKPLYYWIDEDAHRLLVASEPKAILAALQIIDPAYKPRIDLDGFLDTSLYGVPVAPYSVFRGIRSVRPGHTVTITYDSSLAAREEMYWDLTVREPISSPEAARTAIQAGLRESTRIRTRSDAGLALMLSGGLDSSVLTYLVPDVIEAPGARRRAYTIGDPDKNSDQADTFVSGSDLEYARLVAEESGHELVEHTDMVSDPVSFIRKCARSRDSIVTLGSEIAMAKLFELIGRKDRVLISGDGADEVFLGYFMQTDVSGKVDQFFSSRNSRFLPLLYRRTFVGMRSARRRGAANFRSRLAGTDPGILGDKKNLMHYLQLRFTLPYLLDRADTLSMAESIELRVPYLDHRLVETVFNIDSSLRYSDEEKELLRSAFRSHYNPKVIDRKKSVFPYGETPEYMESLRKEANRILADRSSLVHSVYRTRVLRQAFASAPVFRLCQTAVGQFYLHAFICQLISLDELGHAYGLTA